MYNIQEIEKSLIKKKDWQYLGEVDSKKRPTNSLLSKKDIHYDVTEQIEPISVKQNSEIQKMTLQRIREGTFDNYDYSKEYLIEEEEVVNNEEDNEDICILYNEIESELLKISDFGSLEFMPDTEITRKTKIEIKKDKKKMKAKSLGNIKNVTVLK